MARNLDRPTSVLQATLRNFSSYHRNLQIHASKKLAIFFAPRFSHRNFNSNFIFKFFGKYYAGIFAIHDSDVARILHCLFGEKNFHRKFSHEFNQSRAAIYADRSDFYISQNFQNR